MVKKQVDFEFKGNKLTLFYINELSRQLGVQVPTIRKWEISGLIPKTPFRDKNGYRLYLKEHIECIVNAAEMCQIGQGKSNYRTFKLKVYKGFNEVSERLGLKSGGENNGN